MNDTIKNTDFGDYNKLTPMMKQFVELKQQYNDCILLFRAGDFYETFYDDAKVCSEVLGITLTKRGEIPMAGVPFHSINPYIKKLLTNNFKIAMCEQLEDPKKAKGLVKRGITRIITPGTVLEDEYLQNVDNNFILCIYSSNKNESNFGLSIVDITTGEFYCSESKNFDDVKTFVKKYQPNEIILPENCFKKDVKNFILNSGIYYNFLSDVRFNIFYANEIIKKQFGFNCEEMDLKNFESACISSGALLFYLYKLQKLELTHINKIKYINLSSSMILDSISLRNLEIIDSLFTKEKNKTLFGILNKTKTALGSRLLKQQLVSPLLEIEKIEKRLDAIEEFNEFVIERNIIRDSLSEVNDILRISSRISSGIASPRDLIALKYSLEQLPKIKETLMLFTCDIFMDIKNLDSLTNVCDLLESAIIDEAPSHTRDFGFLKKTYNKELEELSNMAFNSKDYLKELEESLRLNSKINTLKIKYNRIFGYFIEVPKSQEKLVLPEWEVRQTLANSMRYTTPELKEKETQILQAEDKIKNLELELYEKLVDELKIYVKNFQEISNKIALIDVIASHSLNSQLYNYVRPKFNEKKLDIIEGRNPIVEQFESNFVSNDVYFDNEETFKVITGPNMAGKSTYLRQTALICLMGQVGSFIPAKEANLKIYDRIFTRIGAHDELASGQSTFMVEMSETANILNNATKNSLVLLDEIGRGTSTYDGLSIAWAVTEELARNQANTIFATHYHQLNLIEENFSNVFNYHVVVEEKGDSIKFIRKIVKGGTDKSFGIHVGRLAGIPQRVLQRAEEIQKNIEDSEDIVVSENKASNKKNNNERKINELSNKKLDHFLK